MTESRRIEVALDRLHKEVKAINDERGEDVVYCLFEVIEILEGNVSDD